MIVRFVHDYIFTPDEDRRVSVKYKAGWRGRVRQPCAERAIACGAAEAADPPPIPQARPARPARRRERGSRAKAQA